MLPIGRLLLCIVLQKKSYKEIAEDSGVSIKTIAYRIQQATKLLRKDLADLLTTIIVCIMSIVR
ncbi:sigma factor-like helix-turn-helix DNA-binding protein [Bacteroides faecis]|uniref:sigma factor-like helix-turn-helix DNA-binding protein n=1 Tax=Bacteroides faecis TaxID=674529 RepID=UPI0039C41E56